MTIVMHSFIRKLSIFQTHLPKVPLYLKIPPDERGLLTFLSEEEEKRALELIINEVEKTEDGELRASDTVISQLGSTCLPRLTRRMH